MEDKSQALTPKVFTHSRFGKLRVVVINGVAYFIAKDVATALNYKNTTEAIRYHVDPLDKREEKVLSPGGIQKVILINKSGVYSLLLDSNMPKAKEYRHWVTSEVLPSVDETGSYSVAPAAEPAQLKRSKRSEGQLSPAFVYVLLMSNNLVLLTKLGQSKNIRKRIAQIKRETGLTVKDIYFTPLMPRDKARLIEGLCKEKFSAQRIKGEFFSAKFDDVCEAVNRFMEMAFATVPQSQVSNFERAEKIFALVNAMPESHERKQMLLTFAKLIADEKFS